MPRRHVYSVTQHLGRDGDPFALWSTLAFAHLPDYTATVHRPLVNMQEATVPVLFYQAQLEMSAGAQASMHLQGMLELATRVTPRIVCEWFSGFAGANGCTVEFARNPHALFDYTRKKDPTYIEGPWVYGEFVQYGEGQGKRTDIEAFCETISEHGLYHASKVHQAAFMRCAGAAERYNAMHGPASNILGVPTVLRPWQQTVFDLIQAPADDRTILWLHDSQGNRGKTKLCKYLQHHVKAIALEVAPKSDLAYILAQELDKANPFNVVIFDIPRSKMEYMGQLYGLAEKLKDGEFVSSKYCSRTCRLPRYPHIIFLANEQPDFNKWSADRVKVLDLDTLDASGAFPPEIAFPEAFA